MLSDLPVIDLDNPDPGRLLLINNELKKMVISLNRQLKQQRVEINRISSQKLSISRELKKREIYSQFPSPTKKTSLPVTTQTTHEEKIPKQEEFQTSNSNFSTAKTNFTSSIPEVELVYRDKLHESEQIASKYRAKYKEYKRTFPKEDFISLKENLERKENELKNVTKEKSELEEKFKGVYQNLHETTQKTHALIAENGQLKNGFFEMQRKNELLMEELSVMAAQNNELIEENEILKGNNEDEVLDNYKT